MIVDHGSASLSLLSATNSNALGAVTTPVTPGVITPRMRGRVALEEEEEARGQPEWRTHLVVLWGFFLSHPLLLCLKGGRPHSLLQIYVGIYKRWSCCV